MSRPDVLLMLDIAAGNGVPAENHRAADRANEVADSIDGIDAITAKLARLAHESDRIADALAEAIARELPSDRTSTQTQILDSFDGALNILNDRFWDENKVSWPHRRGIDGRRENSCN